MKNNQTFIFYNGEMWLLNKISCEIQILNEKVGKLMIENGKLEEENKNLKEELRMYKKQYQHSMGFMEEDTLQELKDIGEI